MSDLMPLAVSARKNITNKQASITKEKNDLNLMSTRIKNTLAEQRISLSTFLKTLGINRATYYKNIVNANCTVINAKGLPELAAYYSITSQHVFNLIHSNSQNVDVMEQKAEIKHENTCNKYCIAICAFIIFLSLVISIILLTNQNPLYLNNINGESISYSDDEGYQFVNDTGLITQVYSEGNGTDIDMSQFLPINSADVFSGAFFNYSVNEVHILRKKNVVIIKGNLKYYPKNKPTENHPIILYGIGVVAGDSAAISYRASSKENKSNIYWTGSLMMNITNSSRAAQGYYMGQSDNDDPTTKNIEPGYGFIMGHILLQH